MASLLADGLRDGQFLGWTLSYGAGLIHDNAGTLLLLRGTTITSSAPIQAASTAANSKVNDVELGSRKGTLPLTFFGTATSVVHSAVLPAPATGTDAISRLAKRPLIVPSSRMTGGVPI
jgi:hypothetical protein